MNRERAIRTADCWRVGKVIQQAGRTETYEHESISQAKKTSRGIGLCVVLLPEERGHGQDSIGLFRFDSEAALKAVGAHCGP